VPRTHRLGKVAVGGTFDEFHRGHRILLAKAFEVGEIVMIGLTSDEMLEKYPKDHAVDCYDSRRRQLLCFLSSQSVAERARIIPLHDSYGTTLTNEGLEALIVSEETRRVAGKINRLRRQLRLKPLKIFVIAMVEAEDERPISSTRIRKGEINREGRLIAKHATSVPEKPSQTSHSQGQ
jgi:pantetheine-phosphate adenylyltransferase